MSLGNENGALTARLAGVKVAADGTGSTTGKPQTLVGLVEARCFFAKVFDERGNEQNLMFFDVGGQYVATLDTYEWVKKLRPVNDWLRRQLDAKLAQESAPVDAPKEDQVDVMDTP